LSRRTRRNAGAVISAPISPVERKRIDRGSGEWTETCGRVYFTGHVIDVAYRADLIVEDVILLELKSVDTLRPVHTAQVLTYLKFLNLRVGFLMNFNVTNLMKGTRRYCR
jgi:GxxExxY protein